LLVIEITTRSPSPFLVI